MAQAWNYQFLCQGVANCHGNGPYLKKRASKQATSIPAGRKIQIKFPRNRRMSHKGKGREIPVQPHNLSPHGTFENLSVHFPEGAVVNLQFRLEKSKGKSQNQCEQVYRLANVGIELEFVGLEAEAIQAIEKELKPYYPPQHLGKK
jgi:hypothetical protein